MTAIRALHLADVDVRLTRRAFFYGGLSGLCCFLLVLGLHHVDRAVPHDVPGKIEDQAIALARRPAEPAPDLLDV